MRVINSPVGYVGSEFYVVDLSTEPVFIDFKQQIDDLMVRVVGGEMLITWDLSTPADFDEERCFLIGEKDNTKEIGNIRSTNICLKSLDGSPLKVYIVGQRN